jgi:hypothetical protein
MNDTPLDIDYLMLDRMSKLFEQAKSLNIAQLAVKAELRSKR